MNRTCIIYSSRGDATPESEVSVLANVYRFILDSAKKKAARGAHPDGRDSAKESDACAANRIIQK